MPDWKEVGEDANIADLDEPALARLYAEAIPVPEGVLTQPQQLKDPRRYDVPVTAVCPEYTAEELRGWVEEGSEGVAELAEDPRRRLRRPAGRPLAPARPARAPGPGPPRRRRPDGRDRSVVPGWLR